VQRVKWHTSSCSTVDFSSPAPQSQPWKEPKPIHRLRSLPQRSTEITRFRWSLE
jgi:hypothetical protein